MGGFGREAMGRRHRPGVDGWGRAYRVLGPIMCGFTPLAAGCGCGKRVGAGRTAAGPKPWNLGTMTRGGEAPGALGLVRSA